MQKNIWQKKKQQKIKKMNNKYISNYILTMTHPWYG